MKSPTVLFLLAASSALGQGTFQNLDFEAAVVPNLPSDQAAFIPFTNAFPGWMGYAGTNQIQATVALYNGYSQGAAVDSLIDGHTAVYSNNVISGNYTAVIQAGAVGPPEFDAATAIAQTGLIPASARSLRFDGYQVTADMLLTLNGHPVPFVALGFGPNFTTYGADISAFAGQTAELRFTSLPTHNTFASFFLDDIQLSNIEIPQTRHP